MRIVGKDSTSEVNQMPISYQMKTLMQEHNGQDTFTQLETKEDVVHAGLLEPLRLLVTDLP